MFYHALTGENAPTEDLSPVLLWTNPSPTSEFTAQTVNLNLSEYIGVIVEIKYDINNEHVSSRVYAKKTDNFTNKFGGGFIAQDANAINILSLNDSGIQFGNASPNKTGCIPYKIYGVKEYVVEPVSSVTAEQKFFQANTNQTVYTLDKDYDLLMIDGIDNNSFIGYLDEGNFDEILSGEIYHFAPSTKRLWVKGAKVGFKYEVAYADMKFNFTGLIYNK